MSKILEKLSGDDLRSIGKTNEVVQDIHNYLTGRWGFSLHKLNVTLIFDIRT